MRCARCGRFIGEDCTEGQDPNLATPHDPDGWTGVYYCAPGVGCQIDLLDVDGGDLETAVAGQRAGLTFTLAWSLAYRNDQTLGGETPEQRYGAFLAWIDEELSEATV